MNKTRRVRKGGEWRIPFLKQKSPFREPAVSKNEKNLLAQIKQLEEGIPSIEALGRYEGINVSKSIANMKDELKTLKRKLSNLRGQTEEEFIIEQPKGGRRSRKQKNRRRRITRRRG